MHSLFLAVREAAPSASDGLFHMVILMGGMFGIMYFIAIRPQKKQERERMAMLQAITKNDKVLTSGGIIGVVMSVKEHEVVVKIDDDKNVRVRVARSAITNVLDKDGVEATS